MNIQSYVLWAILAVLLLGQSGCSSLFGHRYYDGSELACTECEPAPQLAGEAGVVPPHSRYHPVPTRPVFSPQPETATITVATHSSPAAEKEIEKEVTKREEVKKPTPRVVGAPVTAPTSANLRTAAAIQRWASDTEPSIAAKPAASGSSSRRVATDEPELAPAPLPADDEETEEIIEAVPQLGPAPARLRTAWTDRFSTGDGWRPRVAR